MSEHTEETEATPVAVTLEQAREILAGGVDSIPLADSFVSAGMTAFREGKTEAEKVSGVAAASLATYVALRTGLIPPSGERAPKDDPRMVSRTAFAKTYNVGGSNVTLWETLGIAQVERGVTVEYAPTGSDPTLWQLLAHRGAGGVATVSAEVARDGSTPESIREACLQVRLPNGRPIPGKRAASANGGTDSTEAAIAKDAVGVALKALSLASDACKAIPVEDREGWSKVEDALREILTRETASRVQKATSTRKAASKRTASKRTARKAAEKVPA